MIDKIRTLWRSILGNNSKEVVDLRANLFERSPLPQAIITPDGKYIDANLSYCTLHEVDKSHLVGKSPIDLGFATPDQFKSVLEVFHQSDKKLEGYLLKYPTAKGNQLYVRVFAHHITLEGKQGILLAVHDVSKQWMTERALKQSENLLNTVLNSIPIRVFWKDTNSVFLGCNKWAAYDAGLSSSSELIGKTDYDLYPKEFAARYMRDDQEVMITGKEKLFFEEEQTHSNGTLLWKLTSKVPLKDSVGNIIGLLGVYDDITARKKVDAELKLAKFSLDHATSSVLWISKSARLVDFNHAFSEMLLYSRSELLALTIPDIDPLYTKEKWPAHWEELRQRQVLTFFTQQRRKDGKVLDVEVRAHYLEFDGKEYNCAFINDITETKQSIERLHLSHSFQQAVLNNIPSGVFWKDKEFKYLGANKFFLDIANFKSDEELIGKTDYELPWVEQVEKIRSDDREVIEKNVSKLNFVEPLRTADGEIHYNEVSKVPLLNDRGDVIGVLGTFRDITEQLGAETALRESEKLFKSVVQNASAIIYIIDREGIFRLSEGLGLATLGLKPGEVIGKSVFEMYNDFPEITTSIRRALQGEVIENEISIHGLTFSTRYTPMFNDDGTTASILCVSFDITSLKNLEQRLNALNEELAKRINELKESELKFRQIIQFNPMAIFVYEVDAEGQLILVESNPASDVLTGVKNNDLVGKTIEETFPGLEKTEMPARYLEAAVSGKPWFIDDFYFENVSIKGTFQVYAFQAGHDRVAVMFLNITERKQIEAAIKLKNDELIKTNAELDRFVYSASHDLRAPIASLLGLVAVARAEKDVQGMSTLLDMQERSLHKLDTFIQDIVSYSRNNRVKVEATPVNFQHLIKGIFEQLQYMDDLTRVEKRISVPSNLTFSSDGKRISVILNNLISNAIKYSDTFKPNPFVEVAVEPMNDGVNITVTDNGQGIDDKYLPKIFDMFFRATTHSSGSGIGLYIVQEIVHKMQGKINVESIYGRGSMFTVWLPNLN